MTFYCDMRIKWATQKHQWNTFLLRNTFAPSKKQQQQQQQKKQKMNRLKKQKAATNKLRAMIK